MQYKIFTLIAAFAMGSLASLAQDETMRVQTGGTFGKPKIVPRLEKFALAQLSVN